jgi:hypothetical protein
MVVRVGEDRSLVRQPLVLMHASVSIALMTANPITPGLNVNWPTSVRIGLQDRHITMKTLLITTLTAAIALTHTAYAGGWMWFHADIGTASPFVSSSPPKNNVTTRVVTGKKAVTKGKAASNRSVGRTKFQSPRHSITAR